MHSPSTVVSLRSMEASGGVRDHTLLQSTLARPRQLYAYRAKVDMAALAAAYTFGIVRDGNKRTGFVLAVLFLEINDHNFCCDGESRCACRSQLGGRCHRRIRIRRLDTSKRFPPLIGFRPEISASNLRFRNSPSIENHSQLIGRGSLFCCCVNYLHRLNSPTLENTRMLVRKHNSRLWQAAQTLRQDCVPMVFDPSR